MTSTALTLTRHARPELAYRPVLGVIASVKPVRRCSTSSEPARGRAASGAKAEIPGQPATARRIFATVISIEIRYAVE